MPRIAHIYYAPVKSLALTPLARTHVDKAGIPGDRAFVIVDAQGDAVTQRECFPLVLVRAVYEPVDDHLTVTLPDGTVAAGVPEPGASAPITGFWDQAVPAVEARGPWDDALSAFAGRPLRLVRPAPGRAFDGYPLSICSLESLDALAAAAGEERVDGRRFRQNI